MQNGFIESFKGRLRDELLNEALFPILPYIRASLAAWRGDYNLSRPHSQLGWLTPSEYADTVTRDGTWRCAQWLAPRQPPSLTGWAFFGIAVVLATNLEPRERSGRRLAATD